MEDKKTKPISYGEFIKGQAHGTLSFTAKEVLADLDTPLSCYTKIGHVYPGPSFLLESVEQSERLGRFSLLGFDPFLIFKSTGRKVFLNGIMEDELEVDNPYLILREIMRRFNGLNHHGHIPFLGGAVGYAGYDVVRFFERLPDITEKTIDIYDMHFVFPSKLIIFDNFTRRMTMLCVRPADGRNCMEREDKKILDELLFILRRPLPLEAKRPFTIKNMVSHVSKEGFESMVEKAKGYIYAGDIIQVVLSQRSFMEVDADDLSLYRALRVVNPSPYMFLLEFPEYSLIGSSPETMVKMEGGYVEVRPIAGTRKRGKDKKEDEKLAEELLSDEKELAEHTMLVDLGRNDVGRVAATGTITLPEFMVVERYSHVMHIVSSVKGRIRDGLDAFDVFQATFPAGTVTGAPKIRAMEIIEELEREKREFYAGAVGYFSYSGDMDFCIAIRTLLKKGNRVYIQAGAGIVADSIPEKEYMETLYKSRAMVKSIMELKEIIA